MIRAKGFDVDDQGMRKAVAFRIVLALSLAAERGKIANSGMRKGVRVWADAQAQQIVIR